MMSFADFYEKLYGIKLNQYQKEMLDDYCKDSSKRYVYIPMHCGRTYVGILQAMAKAYYESYKEGEIKA